MLDGKIHFNPIHLVRGLQGLLSILTLGLLAHVAQWYNANSGSTFDSSSSTNVPNEIVFGIFVSVWTLLVTLPYVLLTPRFFPHLFKSTTKYTVLALESINMILWFSAFVAAAAFIGKLAVCRGDVCHAAKAGAGIAAISWLSWGVTSLFALRFCLGITSSGGKGAAGGGGIEKGERTREKLIRGLRLHSVWTGHAKGEKQAHHVSRQSHATGYPRNEWESVASQANRI